MKEALNAELCAAVLRGDVFAATELLEQGADPNAVGTEGYSMLCDAAVTGNVAMVRALLRYGARPEDAGTDGTPLMFAINRKHQEVVDCLLDWRLETGGDIGIHARNGINGSTALYLATNGPSMSVVRRLLLEAGADPNMCNNQNWSPLSAVCFSDDNGVFELEAVKLLLACGAKPELRNDGLGFTALHSAVFKKKFDCAAELVKHGVDVNASSSAGYTALGCTYLLSQKDADPNAAFSQGYTRLAFVRLLLDAGADPDKASAEWTPLQIASQGNAEVVAELLRRGADVNKRPSNRTALFVAAYNKQADVLRLLLDAGADMDIGMNPMSTDWNYVVTMQSRWLREGEAALRESKEAQRKTEEGFRFAIPHMLEACRSSSAGSSSSKRPRLE